MHVAVKRVGPDWRIAAPELPVATGRPPRMGAVASCTIRHPMKMQSECRRAKCVGLRYRGGPRAGLSAHAGGDCSEARLTERWLCRGT